MDFSGESIALVSEPITGFGLGAAMRGHLKYLVFSESCMSQLLKNVLWTSVSGSLRSVRMFKYKQASKQKSNLCISLD